MPNRYLPLSMIAGDAHRMLGNLSQADSIYRAIRTAEITPGYTEAAYTRLAMLADSLPAAEFKTYFITPMSDTARVAALAMGVAGRGRNTVLYMRGRIELRYHRDFNAAALLAMAGKLERDSTMEALRRIYIGDALLRLGRTQEAREWYWTSRNFDNRPYAAARSDDRIARCDWLTGLHR